MTLKILAYRAGNLPTIGHGIFFTEEHGARAYARIFGGRVRKAELTLNNPLDLLNPPFERVDKILKKIFPTGRHGLKEVKDQHGKLRWEDIRVPVTVGNLGREVRGDAWIPIIEYARRKGHDSIITKDTGPLLEMGIVSYIIFDRRNIRWLRIGHKREIS